MGLVVQSRALTAGEGWGGRGELREGAPALPPPVLFLLPRHVFARLPPAPPLLKTAVEERVRLGWVLPVPARGHCPRTPRHHALWCGAVRCDALR